MSIYHLEQIPTNAEIRKFLRGILFGKHIFCPDCKGKQIISRQGSRPLAVKSSKMPILSLKT